VRSGRQVIEHGGEVCVDSFVDAHAASITGPARSDVA
jgi:hypothetical protein